MAVYKRNYSAYTGPITGSSARTMTVARYAMEEAWSSRLTIAVFIVCLLPCIIFLFGIYLANNPAARLLVGAKGGFLAIDERFFLKVLQTQAWLGLVLASWMAPRLITFDLSDNALPILLSHPISRVQYVGGKLIALLGSLSAVTWVPCLLLFVYQGYASQTPWAASHLHIALGLFAGTVIWISFLAILGLALSTWVKWRVVATGLIFAAILVPAGVGGIISAVLRTRWGFLLNIPVMMTAVWQRLLGAPSLDAMFSLPSGAIAAMLILITFLCIYMLHARIRAREVVRG